MKVSFDTLAIEVTRRCNMCCEHCMRGDAQAADIDFEVIDRLLEQTSYISNLILTGGEPSLNAPALKYIAKRIKELDIFVGSVFLATNGKEVSDEFMLACLELFMHAFDDELSGLVLSQDIFHEDIPPANIYKLKQLAAFRSEAKKTDFTRTPLLNLGRAKNLDGFNHRLWTPETKLTVKVDEESETLFLYDSSIAVIVNGDILTDYDYSYDETDNLKIGSVMDRSWVENIAEEYAAA